MSVWMIDLLILLVGVPFLILAAETLLDLLWGPEPSAPRTPRPLPPLRRATRTPRPEHYPAHYVWSLDELCASRRTRKE